MRIFIDARFYGTEHTGLGRYTKNVLEHLPELLKGDITILVHPKYQSLKFGRNWQVITSRVRPYSLAEQFVIPLLIGRSRADLYLGFHFNIPLLISTPFITVIHDLIKSHFSGPDTTTRTPWLYTLKRWAYELTMRRTVTQALALIVPTNTVKNDILARYNLEPSLIYSIPEAIDTSILRPTKYQPPCSNYLLYVGNAYPHKNISTLLKAVHTLDYNLVIVSKRNMFLEKELSKLGSDIKARVYVQEEVTDQELAGLYQGAVITVSPSLMEGYGLPGVESLALGVPIVASNIPVFREVYGERAEYFEPKSVPGLTQAIKRAAVKKRLAYKSKHTWGDVARGINEVINESRTRLR